MQVAYQEILENHIPPSFADYFHLLVIDLVYGFFETFPIVYSILDVGNSGNLLPYSYTRFGLDVVINLDLGALLHNRIS